ncbi:MAG: universal stress protein [Acidobacteriia bacterium]|nr:universal stress protein [Terriglobia bacterium]
MSQAEQAPAIRRILVALDTSPNSLAALEGAVALAARVEAELLGLFVEDVELLQMADSPHAREILYPSATESRISRPGMELRLRIQSERARNALAAAAESARVPWSFQTMRGNVASELMAAVGEGDLLALGKRGWSPGSQFGSTALRLATSAIPVLLHPAAKTSGQPRLQVYYDDSPAAKRALIAAGQLAEDGGSVTILHAAASTEQAQSMENEIALALKGRNLAIRFQRIVPNDEASLLRAIREEQPGLLILGSREPFRRLQSLEALLRDGKTSVLLLGDGIEP